MISKHIRLSTVLVPVILISVCIGIVTMHQGRNMAEIATTAISQIWMKTLQFRAPPWCHRDKMPFHYLFSKWLAVMVMLLKCLVCNIFRRLWQFNSTFNNSNAEGLTHLGSVVQCHFPLFCCSINNTDVMFWTFEYGKTQNIILVIQYTF